MKRALSTMVHKARRRRTSGEMAEIRGAILRVLEHEHPATVRSVFYRLVALGAVAKTEGEYKRTVVRLLTEMRRDGALPWAWITDGTRYRRKPQTHASLQGALTLTRQTYRRDLWSTQNAYVEIWVEKTGLVGLLGGVTEEFDVSLMPCAGYPSHAFLHEAAAEIADIDRLTFVAYFGDRNPSGVDIDRFVEERLREYAPDAVIVFERLAVTPLQVEELNLPTRPTKETDARSRSFRGDSVEVDAIPPSILRDIARDFIVRHINADRWSALQAVEAAERETLQRIEENWARLGRGGKR